MNKMLAQEHFPAASQSRQYVDIAESSPAKPRKRRPSIHNLPGEIRGDTGAAALSTLTDQKEDPAAAAESAKVSAAFSFVPFGC